MDYSLTEYKSDLQSSGQFADDEKLEAHMLRQLSSLKAYSEQMEKLKFGIQSTFVELDKLSNKKFTLFDVKDWRKNLDKIGAEYKELQKELQRETEYFNETWGNATAEDIKRNQVEWLKDRNKLLTLEKKNLDAIKDASAKAMAEFRNGSNVFDKFGSRMSTTFSGMTKGVNEMQTGFGQMINAVKDFTRPWAEANQAASEFSKSVGLGAAGMNNLLSETIRFGREAQIGILNNKSLKEMLKLQQDYVLAIGRNISLTDKQKKSLLDMSSIMGDQKAVDFVTKLENFGIDTKGAGDRFGKMFAEASKKGIAIMKYSELFANNIKMAQNYTFANGVKGVASMAEKATKLKLEMQSVANFADKVNTVSGAIETGAKLQVLGGPFAQFADPLQMLYEGTSDVEGLQDRIINMFGDLGHFNKRKGEVEVSAFDRMRINTASEAIGVNSSELMEMIHAKGRRNEILNQMKGLGYNDEMKELILNVAHLNEKGEAGVSLDGEFVALDQLYDRQDELVNLNKSESDDIKDIAKMLRGWDDIMQGFQKQKDIRRASLVELTGIGHLAMSAVGFLGQSSWALNSIVSLLTARQVAGFGMGAYGMLQGGTRTVAGAFQGTRMNNWMSKNGMMGGIAGGRGYATMPAGAFNSNSIRGMVGGSYAARGAGLGIATGAPFALGGTGGAFIPGGVAGTPSMSPFMGGAMGPMGMGPMGMGVMGMAPWMMGNGMGTKIALSNGKVINTAKLGAGESFVTGKGGHVHHVDAKGNRTYIGRDTKDGFQQSKSVKSIKPVGGGMGTPHAYNIDGASGRLTDGIKGKLKDGSKFNSNNFRYNEQTGLLTDKKGNYLKVDKNGNLQLRNKSGRLVQNIGRYDANGSITASRSLSNAKNVSGVTKPGGGWGTSRLGSATAMMGGMLLGVGLGVGASMYDAKTQEMVANGQLDMNSDEFHKRQTTSSALNWASQGASMGAMLGSFFGPVGTLIGGIGGGLIGGIAGYFSGDKEAKKLKKEQEEKKKTDEKKKKLISKISKYRRGYWLRGDYPVKTLERIAKYVETGDSYQLDYSDIHSLQSNNEFDYIVDRVEFGNGTPNISESIAKGKVHGPSHADGGVKAQTSSGDTLLVEGNEGIVPKHILDKLEQQSPGFSDKLFSGRLSLNSKSLKEKYSISPTVIDNMFPSVLPNSNSSMGIGGGNPHITIDPLDININGVIKLDLGKDMQEINLSNETKLQLAKSISPIVNEHITRYLTGKLNKEGSPMKWASQSFG